MIDRLINIVSMFLSITVVEWLVALNEELNKYIGRDTPPKTPKIAEPEPSDPETEELFEILSKIKADIEEGPVRPFAYHLNKHLGDVRTLNRTEVIEGMLLSLESLGSEIKAAVGATDLESRVEREERPNTLLIHGHLRWKVDKQTPAVYSIIMDLLKDGFIYRADTNSFVITSKVAK